MCEEERPDELMADFQQTYHLDLWAMQLGDLDGEATMQTRRAAALAWQLPSSSRVWSGVAPLGALGTDVMLLRQIEHDVRVFQWSFSEDAKNKDTAPEPLTLPGEEEAHRLAEERADRAAIDLAAEFGLKL